MMFLEQDDIKELTAQDLRGFVLSPELEPLDCRESAPTDCGIYALFGADDCLLYIGKARNLNQRLNSHRCAALYRGGKRYAKFIYQALPEGLVGQIEIAHIAALTPPLNVLYEPATWSRHDELVLEVTKAWDYIAKDA